MSRTYTGVDDPADVTRDATGTWHIKAGARVKVKLEMVSRSAQTHVGADRSAAGRAADPQPRPGHHVEGSRPRSPPPRRQPTSWYSTWYDHQNLRDDQAEAFATYLQGGVYDYSYLARATTDGTFVAPPTRAEQVYAPETFGRGASDRVVIGS